MKYLLKMMLSFVLGIIFYIVITPISFILRILKLDILNILLDKNKKSYWIERSNSIKNKNFFHNGYKNQYFKIIPLYA